MSFFGKLNDEHGNSFEQTEAYQAVKEKLYGVIYLRKSSQLHDLAIAKMKTAKLTYEEVKENKSKNFQLLEMMRIKQVLDNTFQMMDAVFEIPNPKQTKESK